MIRRVGQKCACLLQAKFFFYKIVFIMLAGTYRHMGLLNQTGYIPGVGPTGPNARLNSNNTEFYITYIGHIETKIII